MSPFVLGLCDLSVASVLAKILAPSSKVLASDVDESAHNLREKTQSSGAVQLILVQTPVS